MESPISVYCIFTDKRDFEVGMNCFIRYVKGCTYYFPEDLGLEGLYFGNIGGFCRAPQLYSVGPHGLQECVV